jgi:hypothetical protein
MTQEELKNSIRDIIKRKYKQDILTPIQTVEYDELTKFPELKQVIVDLLTPDYSSFLSSIDWVAPRPTTFRINLKNNQDFYLIYGKRSWIAQIEGKKYYLLNLPEEERAAEAIARILRYGSKEEPSEDNEGFEDTTTKPPKETPPAEETPPTEETPIAEVMEKKTNLKELEVPKHFSLRTQQRGTATNIINLNQQMVGDKNVEEVKQQLINEIETEFKKRLSYLENLQTLPVSFTNTVIYKIIKPILISGGVKYDLMIEAQSTVGDTDIETKYIGTFYYVIIDDDKLFTIKLGNKETDDDLIKKTQAHQSQKDRPTKPVKILTFTDFEYPISLDESTQEKNTINPNELPYKLRTDYRKGAEFEHDQYGKGTIITTSAGNGGKGDSRGRLDWVEVDFGKPYVSGGQLKTTRIIKNIYTLVSPDFNTKAAE